jgi:hypothetical protein
MSGIDSSQRNNSKQNSPANFPDNYSQYDNYNYEDESQSQQNNQGYFSARNNIINEKMVRYQKRQLPPLQRYTPNQQRNMYAEFNRSYWEEDDDYQYKHRNTTAVLNRLWQKFVVTFASILSLVCLSWIAYNWNGDKNNGRQNSESSLIEPSQPSFKVLPKDLGGVEIEYKDKSVYDRIDHDASSLETEEELLPPQEEPSTLPPKKTESRRAESQRDYRENIEEYSIVEDKVYYIKISAGKDKTILENEAAILKKKFSTLLTGKSCSVKKVSNASGELKHAILIGPFTSQDTAVDIARDIGGQCYVISVKE